MATICFLSESCDMYVLSLSSIREQMTMLTKLPKNLLGIKVITLWGATHPFAGFAPFNQPLENCLVSDREKFPLLPTSVYGNKKVEGYGDAMRSISPEKVVFSIQSQLAASEN